MLKPVALIFNSAILSPGVIEAGGVMIKRRSRFFMIAIRSAGKPLNSRLIIRELGERCSTCSSNTQLDDPFKPASVHLVRRR